jgi:UDP:flavonoid glycosyltransferase YjiC (YdhE family)
VRVLFLSTAGIGQVFPLIPVAWAFRSAGHEVLLGTCGEGLIAANAGLPIADIAPNFRMQEFAADTPIEPGREAARRRDMSFDVSLFDAVNRQLVNGALQLAATWRPDLVIHEEMAALGPLVAAVRGVPVVQQNVTFVPVRELRRAFAQRLADLYEQRGLSGPPERTLTLDPAPPSMVAEREGWSVRFVSYSGGGVQPGWLREKPDRPRIAVTIGTVTPIKEGLGLVRRIIDCTQGVDGEFVLALGGASAESLGALPPNVRAFDWVPLNALLATCVAVVHHGGGGTTMTALEAGVPQLVLPNFADRFINSDAVRDRGVGFSAEPDELDAALLERLLTDERLRVAAHEVQAELQALPSPAEAVQRLASLW